jgi:hypothetical protein
MIINQSTNFLLNKFYAPLVHIYKGIIRHFVESQHKIPFLTTQKTTQHIYFGKPSIPSYFLFGNIKPTQINQIKPGNLVSGIRGKACGKTRSNQLKTPKTPRTIPKMHNHFESNFMMRAGMEIPAINNPMGTEKPTPPNPN